MIDTFDYKQEMKDRVQFQLDQYNKIRSDRHSRAYMEYRQHVQVYAIDDPELHKYYETDLKYRSQVDFELYMLYYKYGISFNRVYRNLVHREPCYLFDYMMVTSVIVFGVTLLSIIKK